MILTYIITILTLIYIIYKTYIKMYYKFWITQPVYHYHNVLYYFKENEVINKTKTDMINKKYLNYTNIKTLNVKELTNENIIKITEFIKNNYLKNKFSQYIPSISDIFNYLVNNQTSSYISLYTTKYILHDKNNNKVNQDKINGIITSKPINIYLNSPKNKTKLRVNYVDNLCVDKNKRKQGVAPQLIQTHYNDIKSSICLFKQESNLTKIVPLVKYDTYCYDITLFPKIQFNYFKNNLVSINKENIILLNNFLNTIQNSSKLKCFIIFDIDNLINLLINKNIIIYGLVSGKKITAIYVFRNSPTYYENKKVFDNISNISIMELNNSENINLFYSGFLSAVRRFSRKYSGEIILIENYGDAGDIITKLNDIPILSKSTMAYFLYNYIKQPIIPKHFSCII